MACVTHPDPSQDDLGICECSEQLLTPAWTITASVPDGACELSNDFTKHYGESVYVCRA